MQKHWLPLLSIMLLLGLSATGRAAVTDATGDQFVAGKDLLWADALFYPPTPLPVADWVRLTVTMNTGSTLPGMIVWDIDADNNVATGGSSFLNMPFSPCPAGGCKTERGFDFYVLLVLRDQGDAGHTAYCAGCEDYESNCARRGNPVECLEGICFEPGEMCYPGEANCYKKTDACTGNLECENAYPLDEPCTLEATNCGSGLQCGEFYVGFGAEGIKNPIYRGRLSGMSSIVNYNTQYWFFLPYGEIISYAAMMGAVVYDDVVFNPNYQVSVWHDLDPFDGDDMFDSDQVLNLADYLPDSGYAASSAGAPECHSDFNMDCAVGLTDLVQMKSEFNRTNCPNCLRGRP